MDILITTLTILVVLIAIFLTFIILAQRSKSGGGLGAVSGGTSEAVFGANAGNILKKITTWTIVVFFSMTLALCVLSGHRTQKASLVEEGIEEKTDSTTIEKKEEIEKGVETKVEKKENTKKTVEVKATETVKKTAETKVKNKKK
ncbi:MAG: preprotein translocase subunit SecG [Verrucomicrobiota bacterium]|nr:preprotein translocase subunit SecG [Verrucomicrobiota bacterium]